MPGRDVGIPARTGERRGSNGVLVGVVGAVVLLAVGIALGSRIGAQHQAAIGTRVTSGADVVPDPAGAPRPSSRTQAAAVEAAVRSITAFDGDVLLDPVRAATVVTRIASLASRSRLIAAFTEASIQTRAKLGADTAPRPVIVLRSVPVGYRIDRFSPDEATVAVWYVGIVASGATVDPQQSWRTQIVALVWERGAWRVSSFESSSGPTPPVSTAEAPPSPSELFAAIPQFEEFDHAEP